MVAATGSAGYSAFPLAASGGRGRVTVTVSYSDGTSSAVHYYVLPPFEHQAAAVSSHYVNDAWLPREFVDPFGRSASMMPWDRETKTHVGRPCLSTLVLPTAFPLPSLDFSLPSGHRRRTGLRRRALRRRRRRQPAGLGLATEGLAEPGARLAGRRLHQVDALRYQARHRQGAVPGAAGECMAHRAC